MKKDAKTFIKHILECIELVEKYTDNKTGSLVICVEHIPLINQANKE